MALTDIERDMAKAVAQNYFVNREATSHEQLLRRSNDPRPINTLKTSRIIRPKLNFSHLYLPTILAFQYCGDEDLRQNAKSAVEVVIAALKNLFQTHYDMDKMYPVEVLVPERPAGVAGIPGPIVVGLFLAKEIPGVFLYSNEQGTEITSFRISEHISTLDPKAVWDEYVRRNSSFEEPQTPESMVAKANTQTSNKRTSDWPPAPWKIEESLGEGGQGWTYKVRISNDRNIYVLKRLKNKERLSRFRAEIAALTKLQHPGILKIIDTGEASDTPFFIAEYCDGADLSKANLSSKDLLSKLGIFREVCDAVAAAHNANILHRDLKPPNIFIRKDQSVVVGDFGLCIDLTDMKERATQSLEGVGAERYIAPEVAKGRVPEPQPTSDIYSFGKVLYFILSGRTLIREEYAEGQDDLRKSSAGLSMHFVYEIFDKTIRERPQDRFQNASKLLYALDTVIERVRLKAHVLKPYVPQHCLFCVIGEYQRTTGGPAGNEVIFVCTTCGNMQRFTSATQWWGKK